MFHSYWLLPSTVAGGHSIFNLRIQIVRCKVDIQILVDVRCSRGTMLSSYCPLPSRVAGCHHLFEFGGAYMPVTRNLGRRLLRKKRACRPSISKVLFKGAQKVTRTGNLIVEECTPSRRRTGAYCAASMGTPTQRRMRVR